MIKLYQRTEAELTASSAVFQSKTVQEMNLSSSLLMRERNEKITLAEFFKIKRIYETS